jgi:molybdopterin molybdotransferase
MTKQPHKGSAFFPNGVSWTPVDEALEHLRLSLKPILDFELINVSDSLDYILYEDILANRSNPPVGNTAVDGFGFAHQSIKNQNRKLNLCVDRIAAGDSYQGIVPQGSAIKILTGAELPRGVDTVVLQEEVTIENDNIILNTDLKRGENTRKVGEDIEKGKCVLTKGSRIRAQDIALLIATGINQIKVYLLLKIGILSTGNELIHKVSNKDSNKTLDANRPMLMNIVKKWGYQSIDLGNVNDNKTEIKTKLNIASEICDIIFTSGGASTGDEDYVGRLLKSDGNLYNWRIAMKPGRPLALAKWNETPVIGLPGNPVAAFVCTIVFGRPICGLLSGEGWLKPNSFQVPAAFSKNKKIGRREYLRARVKNGKVEIFHSEGSGRISGLSWADGLVELREETSKVNLGDLVKYIPFSGVF